MTHSINGTPCNGTESPDWMIPFTFAFQPIVDGTNWQTISFEALIRGPQGESAGSVLGSIPDERRIEFECTAREKAIHLAARLGLECQLNLNCLPRSFIDPEDTTAKLLRAAAAAGIEAPDIVLEVTEQETVSDQVAFVRSVRSYQRARMRISIDDFGAGYCGLNLLADLQPDQLKLDMHLIRDIHELGPKQAIVRGVLQACVDLGIDVIAEGVETIPEFQWCRDNGVELFQGYLLAKPGFESLPSVAVPTTVPDASAANAATESTSTGGERRVDAA